jgi:hypothetical protein
MSQRSTLAPADAGLYVTFLIGKELVTLNLRSALRPNPSLKLTRYGRHCKPGLSQLNYRLSPGLQYLPTRAA